MQNYMNYKFSNNKHCDTLQVFGCMAYLMKKKQAT
jgi:hypothetical protein